MQERRRFIRLDTPILVEFPSPGTMKTQRSFTQDVSESGIKFPTPVKLQIGQQLPLTLELPFSNMSMQATGEVMWIREVARLGTPHYEIGVRFQWIDDPDRHRLSRHLSGFFPSRA